MKISPLDSEYDTKPSFLISWRFAITIVFFFGMVVFNIQRSDMSIVIVCMVNDTNQINSQSNNNLNDEQCLLELNNNTRDKIGPFDWNKETQSLILSSYYYGYIVPQVIFKFFIK